MNAEQIGFQAFLMEIDELCWDVIVKCGEEFTGKDAECVQHGDRGRSGGSEGSDESGDPDFSRDS